MSLPTNFFIGRGGNFWNTVTGGLVVLNDFNSYTSTRDYTGGHLNFDTNSNNWYDWVVPTGVENVSMLAIGPGGGGGGGDGTYSGGGGGGGALAYSNNIQLIPGETIRVYAGRHGYYGIDGTYGASAYPTGVERLSDNSILLKANGGGMGSRGNYSGYGKAGSVGRSIGQVIHAGGDGTGGSTSTGGGGGGAGGYSSFGNSIAGGSGWGGGFNQSGLGGGGVGIYGEGTSGTSIVGQRAGSGGTEGTTGSSGGQGGDYGGGGGGGNDDVVTSTITVDYHGGKGGLGVVRIVWGKKERLFPSTLVSHADSDGNETTTTV